MGPRSLFLLLGILFPAFTCSSSPTPVNNNSEPKADSAVRATDLWPGGDVYLLLEFDEQRAEQLEVKEILVQAGKDLAANTGIRLHFITDPSQANGNYWSSFGYQSDGGQVNYVGADHYNKAFSAAETAPHELGHLLGLDHTQNRADRDDNVTVHPQWISYGLQDQYHLASSYYIIGPYDLDSTMHYPSSSFQSTPCAAMSIGINSPDECITKEDPRFKNERNLQFSDWNYSVLAALYCDSRYCDDRCADVDRCETEQVQRNLERLYDWQESREGIALAERYPRNMAGSEIACEVYPARPSEPQARPFEASCDGYNTEVQEDVYINDRERIFWGGVEQAYPIWFQYTATDDGLCEADPSVKVAGEVGVCMYLECQEGQTHFSCPTSTEESTTMQEGQEIAGCCGETEFTVEDLRCEGAESQSSQVYLEVHALDLSDAASANMDDNACHFFRLDYHF